MALVVGAQNEPKTLTGSVLATIRSLDAEQPVYQVRTMDDVIGQSLSHRRLNTVLLAMFALVSVLLASLGTYGVISYSVSQRVREFGIRIALGAQRRDVVCLVMRHGAALALVGSLIGLGGALATARLMNDLLYGVPKTDWISFSSSVLVLAMVALAASFLPAWRASRVDPMVALRYE
jgi:ABC-type antimicrobial peptide transport system permease subunit